MAKDHIEELRELVSKYAIDKIRWKELYGAHKCRYRLLMASQVCSNMVRFKKALSIKDEEFDRAEACYIVASNCSDLKLDVDQAFKDYKFSDLRDKYYLKELIEKRLKDSHNSNAYKALNFALV